MARTTLDARQSVLRVALSMVGSAINDDLSTIFPKINSELAKLFEDRNLLLVSDGNVTVPAAGTSVTFSSNLRLHVNSQVAGGSPTVIDLGSTSRTLSVNLRMVYAVINRTAGTAVVTDDSATLPAQTSANQEVVLIAKRVDATDGTKRVYFRNGFTLSAGQTARFGQGGTVFAAEFAVVDATDTTKKIVMQASGATTAKTLTLASVITLDRTITFPDATDTLVGRATSDTLTNKTFGDAIIGTHIATPSNPSAGFTKIYPKTDGNYYQLTSSGAESQLGGFLTKSYQIDNLQFSSNLTANTLVISLETNNDVDPSATDPIKIGFKDDANNGRYTIASVTSPTSLTLGTTVSLGKKTATSGFLYVFALNNAGTVELFASNHPFWDEGRLKTTSTTGTSGAVLYGANVRTNKSIRLIGRIQATWTSGTGWTAVAQASVTPFEFPKMFVSVQQASTSALDGATTDVVFTSVESDTFNMYSDSTGLVTVPVGGMWLVSSVITSNSQTPASAANRTSYAVVRVNGVDTRYGYPTQSLQNATAVSWNGHVVGTVNTDAGFTLNIAWQQNSGSTVSLNNSSAEQYATFEYLGNFG